MNNTAPNYREFSISKINSPQFKHVKLLLYWPIYGMLFLYFEQIRSCTYNPVYSPLDDYIPFMPAFIIPYFLWFVYLIGGQAWFFFKNVDVFKRCMWFVIITYSITSIVYFVYPTCQLLRPEISGDGAFERVVAGLYAFDTNTNVCPSIHVLGSMAICFSVCKCKEMRKPLILIVNVIVAVLISFSTVFLKQHSIIDVFWGFVLSFVAYPVCFCNNKISKLLMSI